MIEFSERLKAIRKSQNKTQKYVSSVLNITERNYQRLEYGESKPSFDTLISLADLFNVSIDYLVGRTNDPILHKKSE
ncbi:MAG: helix-turn-helix domain-containing protein [Ruminococcus flavefaciens]|nr:helix-turn-helix domain-containing protein [Ruminococcus flavefaciens]